MFSRASLTLMLIAALSCQKTKGGFERTPQQVASPATVVAAPKKVAALALGRDQGPVEATGTALPVREAMLSASVPGRITDIPVVLGQKVKKGQPLVRLDPYGFSLGVTQAEAGLAAATVQADQASRELERAQRLVDAKVAPGATFEQVQAAQQAAAAQKRMAEAGLKQAEKALSDSTVRAPFAGTIDLILKEVGEYAPSMPPTMLLKMVDASSLEIQLHFPENRSADVTTGQKARVRIDSADLETTGEVVFVSNRIQPGTQTFEVRVQIPNPDEKIKAGAFARVVLGSEEEEERPLLVPTRAIQRADGKTFVFVVDGGKARKVAVTLGEARDDKTVVAGGLDAKRPVIISDLTDLADGDAVAAELN